MDGYCGECKEPCNIIRVDFGIGPYEFWGQKCVDTQLADVSNCCEAEAYEDEDLQISAVCEEDEPW